MASDREKTQQRRRKLNEELRGLSVGSLMRGTIVEKVRRCGRSNCICAREATGLHKGKYLTVHFEGKTQTLTLRNEDEKRVQKAIAAYARLWEIVNGLTGCELSDLRREARERGRARRRRNQ